LTFGFAAFATGMINDDQMLLKMRGMFDGEKAAERISL
jgi:hypothetical protein